MPAAIPEVVLHSVEIASTGVFGPGILPAEVICKSGSSPAPGARARFASTLVATAGTDTAARPAGSRLAGRAFVGHDFGTVSRRRVEETTVTANVPVEPDAEPWGIIVQIACPIRHRSRLQRRKTVMKPHTVRIQLGRVNVLMFVRVCRLVSALAAGPPCEARRPLRGMGIWAAERVELVWSAAGVSGAWFVSRLCALPAELGGHRVVRCPPEATVVMPGEP